MKKTVLVTGATGPLASEVATTLAELGYHVCINYRSNRAAAQKLAKKINGTAIRGDVTNPAEVDALVKKIGNIDVLINGVGEFIYKPLAETTNAEFTSVIASNLFSAWYCAKAVLPKMRQKKSGVIINFGSAGSNALTARPFTTPYYIAKTGLVMLTRSLANEEKANGIKIFSVAPGVLPHGVRPLGAPIIPYATVTKLIAELVSSKNKHKTGSYIERSGGWRPR